MCILFNVYYIPSFFLYRKCELTTKEKNLMEKAKTKYLGDYFFLNFKNLYLTILFKILNIQITFNNNYLLIG